MRSPERQREFERRQARERPFRELDELLRVRTGQQIRMALDEHCPEGFPEKLAEQLCRISDALIKDLVLGERRARDLHDGINRIKNEADQRWVNGFAECAEQVRRYGEEAGLGKDVLDGLLAGHLSMLASQKENEKLSRDREASSQVEWSRGG